MSEAINGNESVLIRNAVVHTGLSEGVGRPTAIAFEGGRIVYVGDDNGAARYDGADELIDAHGLLVTPAFVDAHVHCVQQGFLLTQLDLRTANSLGAALDQLVIAAAEQPKGILIGTGWDDSDWPERRPFTAAEIDRAAPGRQVILTRLDGHSAVVSPSMMAVIEGLEAEHGYGASGHMTLDAMAHTTSAMGTLVGPDQRFAAAQATMVDFADHGIVAFHEAAASHIGPAYEIALVRQAAQEIGLLPTFYWGEYASQERVAELVAELGVAGLAGDLNADGSIGSRTAALDSAYADRPGHAGHASLTAEEIAEHIRICTQHGITGGFHCIGEAGLTTVTEGFRLAESQLGRETIRAARHRLEHVEMAGADAIAMMADLGLTASMQPRFDELWGGPSQMYAERLGDRWRGMNPIGALHRAGVNIAFGSDAPVTEPSPWRTIEAAVNHHEVAQRVNRDSAFSMHTAGGWRAAGHDDSGVLTPGAAGHVAIWEGDLDGTLPAEGTVPELNRLLVSGRTIRGPAFGSPAFGSPAFGSPAFGSPAFGRPA